MTKCVVAALVPCFMYLFLIHVSVRVDVESLDHRQSENRAWERLVSAFKHGDCLVTISTGDFADSDAEAGHGLVSGHAYAVLDVREAGVLRMLQVKNPWARKPWRGKFSSADRNSWTDGLKRALGITSNKKFDDMEQNGVFWIEFSDVRQYFKSFFLNCKLWRLYLLCCWITGACVYIGNPQLFAYRTTLHDMWPGNQGPANDTYYLGANPQYTLLVDKKVSLNGSNINSVWILFSRHLTVKEQSEMNSAVGDDKCGQGGGDYFGVHVYK